MSTRAPSSPTPVILRTDAPASTTRWQHTKGTFYTVLVVSNGDSDRPDEYPETVVYQDDNGKAWSRPLSRWHASMTEVPKVSANEGAAGPQAEAQALLNELAKRAQTLPGTDPLLSFDSSMSREEVINQFQRLVERARNRGVAEPNPEPTPEPTIAPTATPEPDPEKAATLVVFEWLGAMWAAVCSLENRGASLADRQAAARGLRARLEHEVAAPDSRQAVAAQLRSPEDAPDAPWHELPLDDVSKAVANGYEVRYLFDHAEGAPAVAVLRKVNGVVDHALLQGARHLQDGTYALHAMSITESTAAALLNPSAPAPVPGDTLA